jgi:hypothetical protein
VEYSKKERFIMASGLKVIAALGAIAAGAAAIFAFKKHKELENYDYEDLDEGWQKSRVHNLSTPSSLWILLETP